MSPPNLSREKGAGLLLRFLLQNNRFPYSTKLFLSCHQQIYICSLKRLILLFKS